MELFYHKDRFRADTEIVVTKHYLSILFNFFHEQSSFGVSFPLKSGALSRVHYFAVFLFTISQLTFHV